VSGARILPPFRRLLGQPREPQLSPLAASDYQRVLSVFNRQTTCHLHQDWHTLRELIASPGLRGWVARDERKIEALTGATLTYPPPYHQRSDQPAAWLRIAYADPDSPASLIDRVWRALLDDLRANGARSIWLLVMEPWIAPIARRWGFRPANTVISLRRHSFDIPASAALKGVTLRAAQDSDFDALLKVDAAAFESMWQYDREMLDLARRHAASLTLLERDGRPVGYQLSTWHIDSGHLARLAVVPDQQGLGLGGLLIEDMLRFFAGRGTHTITVNTQEDNHASQQVYKRYDFRRVSQQVAVWSLKL